MIALMILIGVHPTPLLRRTEPSAQMVIDRVWEGVQFGGTSIEVGSGQGFDSPGAEVVLLEEALRESPAPEDESLAAGTDAADGTATSAGSAE
jgi:hypothetical protein